MKTCIALIRGINVGGKHKLPMKDLKALIEKNGCEDVQTYIQSGNVVFRTGMNDTATLCKRITAGVAKSHGFEPRVLIVTRAELERAVAGNPFPQADENPKSLHLFFLAELPAKPNLESLDALKTPTEMYSLKGKIFYLHTPDGFGTSKAAMRVEQALGVAATARNWRTVTTLLEMAKR
jgi:uncharacterized protein (DUF1697 family)